MSSFSVTITGGNEAIAAFRQATANMRRQANDIIHQTGENTVTDTQKNLTDQGAVKTGRLRGSYQATQEDLASTVGSDVPYAPPIEFGHHTRSGSFVAARPALFPAFEKNRVWMVDQLEAMKV